MKFKIGDYEDTFTKDGQFAIKDGKIYDIFVSSKSYLVGGCFGQIRIVVENDNVLHTIYPLMSGGEYEILSYSKMRDLIEAHERHSN